MYNDIEVILIPPWKHHNRRTFLSLIGQRGFRILKMSLRLFRPDPQASKHARFGGRGERGEGRGERGEGRGERRKERGERGEGEQRAESG